MILPIAGFAEGLGQGIGLAFWFLLMFGLLLLTCMIATAVIVVLYGLRVATFATALGVAVSVPSGVVVGTATGSFWVILVGMAVAFIAGAMIGFLRWGSGSQVELVQGTGYRIVLIGCAFIGIGSGLLFWVFLVGTAGSMIVQVVTESPNAFLLLLLVTLAPVGAGSYVLKRLVLDVTEPHQRPA